jgi:hypothetical protein
MVVLRQDNNGFTCVLARPLGHRQVSLSAADFLLISKSNCYAER